ncbi:hypothetical protein CLAFUW4_13257 [Fulvia fulva]|uniref:Uncharacterized protein n=1 Tax=Passalora fulva TaxID=5499 RepID=A0A9Q8PJ26_PASFU|nr:uncharacterized protein CLAFUR5_13113 [Fulvia fulva]KAK4611979.1 hypothetical protein CLAFUR4_13262 [Fulvia fulva]KAK4612423.1 hypothetical protein CLAFUR0_13267 [Fulvia fulva]UJO23341.1 hypothetical protein CLAFUR5_13113 [Fulvia fulva]WPV20989.1 hypothetical protein CLAFUW4_13257 [Fulvia fulva]WPV36222.1 hypothetical protein CLAFUW7_13264 [Fulvia fulva]
MAPPTTPNKGAGAFSSNTTPASTAPPSSLATPGRDSAYGSMADDGALAVTSSVQAFLLANGIHADVVALFTAEALLENAVDQQREAGLEQPAPAAPPDFAPAPPAPVVPAEAPRRAEVTAGSIPYKALPSFQKRKRPEDEADGANAINKKQKKTAPPPATTTTTTTTNSKANKAITKKTAAAPPPSPKVKDISYDIPATPFADLDWSEAPTNSTDLLTTFPPAALEPSEEAMCQYITPKYITWLRGHVEYISFRLAAVTVMLHRADYTVEAAQIGQFAVDLLGTGIYHIALQLYLKQTDEHDVWLHAEMAIADVIYYLRGGEKKATRGDLFEQAEVLREIAKGMGMRHGVVGEVTWTEKRAMASKRQIANGLNLHDSDDDLMLEEL